MFNVEWPVDIDSLCEPRNIIICLKEEYSINNNDRNDNVWERKETTVAVSNHDLDHLDRHYACRPARVMSRENLTNSRKYEDRLQS